MGRAFSIARCHHVVIFLLCRSETKPPQCNEHSRHVLGTGLLKINVPQTMFVSSESEAGASLEILKNDWTSIVVFWGGGVVREGGVSGKGYLISHLFILLIIKKHFL